MKGLLLYIELMTAPSDSYVLLETIFYLGYNFQMIFTQFLSPVIILIGHLFLNLFLILTSYELGFYHLINYFYSALVVAIFIVRLFLKNQQKYVDLIEINFIYLKMHYLLILLVIQVTQVLKYLHQTYTNLIKFFELSHGYLQQLILLIFQ